MLEKLITVENVNPQFLFGVNNKNIDFIKSRFPKLKIIARGNELKLIGDEEEMIAFAAKFDQLLSYASRKMEIDDQILEKIFEGKVPTEEVKESENNISENSNNIILYGNNAKVIKARTPNQLTLVKEIEKIASYQCLLLWTKIKNL